ncbi:MAG: hypothetical protein LBI01_02795 [Elusimicrobium sp.]|jgi:hypothetical protein|nr:hypothetical protein [Elusimicrobium sp.]
MRRIITITAVTVAPVLLVFAFMQPKRICVPEPRVPPAPSDCVAKTKFTATSFKNECLGLYFQSAAPFLYGDAQSPAPFINFAVPRDNYAVRVMAFQNPYKHIATPDSQKYFLAAAKKNLLATNPKIKITKEEFTSFNGVPALYIGATNNGMIERRYYFRNNDMWTELTFKSKDVNYSKKIKPAQDALIKSIKIY